MTGFWLWVTVVGLVAGLAAVAAVPFMVLRMIERVLWHWEQE